MWFSWETLDSAQMELTFAKSTNREYKKYVAIEVDSRNRLWERPVEWLNGSLNFNRQ